MKTIPWWFTHYTRCHCCLLSVESPGEATCPEHGTCPTLQPERVDLLETGHEKHDQLIACQDPACHGAQPLIPFPMKENR